MIYFLDTNICIYFLKGFFPSLQKKLLATQPNKIKIPAMVVAELFYGAQKSQKTLETMEKIEKFLRPLEVISFDKNTANYYGKIRASLEKNGKIIGHNDIIIAATVLAHKSILVTNNTDEFSRIEGLALENWTNELRKA